MNIYAIGTTNNSVKVESDDPEFHTANNGAVTFVDEAKRFALMSMYEQRMNRSIHKNLATLRQLQAERKQNYERDLEEEIIFARANDIKGLPYEAPPAPTGNGSVFSNRRNLFAAARRLAALKAARITVNTVPNFRGAIRGSILAAPSDLREPHPPSPKLAKTRCRLTTRSPHPRPKPPPISPEVCQRSPGTPAKPSNWRKCIISVKIEDSRHVQVRNGGRVPRGECLVATLYTSPCRHTHRG